MLPLDDLRGIEPVKFFQLSLDELQRLCVQRDLKVQLIDDKPQLIRKLIDWRNKNTAKQVAKPPASTPPSTSSAVTHAVKPSAPVASNSNGDTVISIAMRNVQAQRSPNCSPRAQPPPASLTPPPPTNRLTVTTTTSPTTARAMAPPKAVTPPVTNSTSSITPGTPPSLPPHQRHSSPGHPACHQPSCQQSNCNHQVIQAPVLVGTPPRPSPGTSPGTPPMSLTHVVVSPQGTPTTARAGPIVASARSSPAVKIVTKSPLEWKAKAPNTAGQAASQYPQPTVTVTVAPIQPLPMTPSASSAASASTSSSPADTGSCAKFAQSPQPTHTKVAPPAPQPSQARTATPPKNPASMAEHSASRGAFTRPQTDDDHEGSIKAAESVAPACSSKTHAPTQAAMAPTPSPYLLSVGGTTSKVAAALATPSPLTYRTPASCFSSPPAKSSPSNHKPTLPRTGSEDDDDADGSSDDEGHASTSKSPFGSLRKGVTSKREQVWSYRHNLDEYRKRSRDDTPDPQVDHVIEVQILDIMWQRFVHNVLGGGATSDGLLYGERRRVEAVVNGVFNLNVTTMQVNQQKKGPFMTWKKQLAGEERAYSFRLRTLDQLLRTSHPEYAQGQVWRNIKDTMIESHDSIVATFDAPDSSTRLRSFADEFHTVFEMMGLK